MGQYSLSTRLNALLDAHKLTQQSIFRLSKLVANINNENNHCGNGNGSLSSSTRSLATGVEADEAKQELVSDIHDSLKQQEEDLELLRQEIEEVFESGLGSGGAGRARNSERERERARVAAQAARLGEDLRHARALFRNAQLSAKRAAEAAKQRERTLLCASLQSTSIPNSNNNNNTNSEVTNVNANGTIIRRRGPEKPSSDPDAILADASSDVVAALRRSHTLLSTELSRSRFAQETLDQSGRALADLTEKYSSVNDLLGASKALVSDLLRSQKSDSWYLQTALYLLVGTLGWLIFRRFLWGPIWLLVWLPIKAGLGVFSWVLSLIGLGIGSVGGGGEGAATTTATSLIIKPSATDRPPARSNPDPEHRPSVRVGMGGGGGADGGGGGGQQQQQQHQDNDAKESSLTDQVGDIIDESNKNESQDASREKKKKKKGENSMEAQKPKTVVYRGDGQPLVESDAPRNPKKRMMELEEKAEDKKPPPVGVKEEL